MAGYSGTPLAQKLGIRKGNRAFLENAPDDVRSELKAALAECEQLKTARGPIDFAMLFVKSQAECEKRMAPLARQLEQAGMLWISWPKKASGIATDLREDDVRRIGLGAGLVDVKVCAVNDTWSGLKFVIPVAKRKPARKERASHTKQP